MCGDGKESYRSLKSEDELRREKINTRILNDLLAENERQNALYQKIAKGNLK